MPPSRLPSRPRGPTPRSLLAGLALALPTTLATEAPLSFNLATAVPASAVMEGWALSGDAALAEGRVTLTPPAPGKAGSMHSAHARLGAEGGHPAWYVDTTFRIFGADAPPGEGVAVVASHEVVPAGHLSGAAPKYAGAGLFLDLNPSSDDAKAHPHPWLALVANDGTELAAHDAIGLHTSLHDPAGCTIPGARTSPGSPDGTLTLRLEWDGEAGLSALYSGAEKHEAGGGGPHSWVKCASVTLASPEPLSGPLFFTLTAATEGHADEHSVLLVSGHNTHAPDDVADRGGAMRQGVQTEDCLSLALQGLKAVRLRRSAQGYAGHRGPHPQA